MPLLYSIVLLPFNKITNIDIIVNSTKQKEAKWSKFNDKLMFFLCSSVSCY